MKKLIRKLRSLMITGASIETGYITISGKIPAEFYCKDISSNTRQVQIRTWLVSEVWFGRYEIPVELHLDKAYAMADVRKILNS